MTILLVLIASFSCFVECKSNYDHLDLDTLDKKHAVYDYSGGSDLKSKTNCKFDLDNGLDDCKVRSNINIEDDEDETYKRKEDDYDLGTSADIDYEFENDNHRSKAEKKGRKIYDADWDSLDTRKLPTWYDDAKFGIFIHWGVYSVPAFKSEWFWWHWEGEHKSEYQKYMKDNYPGLSYQDFAPQLTAKHLDTDKWAQLVEDSGAKYFLFTSKHHEGFTHWKSEESWNWNSVDIGPKRDIIEELRNSFIDTNVTFGLYFSLYEWFNPWYRRDKKNKFRTTEFIDRKIKRQLRDLVMRYEPLYIWSDGDWEASSEYWNSTGFLAWLYNESPVWKDVVVNDRWGIDANCFHGDVKTCKDRYNPGKLVPFKWENAMTIDKKSWGYRKEATLDSYLPAKKLIETLIETVSCGGNVIMNIGPTADGRIIPIYEERLREIGAWLKVNGDAIYGTRPWRVQKESSAWKIWYTKKVDRVFAIMCRWPKSRYLRLRSPKLSNSTKVKLLGYEGNVIWEKKRKGLEIDLGKIPAWQVINQKAWVFALDNVK